MSGPGFVAASTGTGEASVEPHLAETEVMVAAAIEPVPQTCEKQLKTSVDWHGLVGRCQRVTIKATHMPLPAPTVNTCTQREYITLGACLKKTHSLANNQCRQALTCDSLEHHNTMGRGAA